MNKTKLNQKDTNKLNQEHMQIVFEMDIQD